MNTDIRVVVISAVTALITSGLVAVVDYTVRKRESDIKMMELAVGLLKEDPKGPLQPAREWAVDVISYYSKGGVPLSDDASLALGGHSILAEQLKELSEKLATLSNQSNEKSNDMMQMMMMMMMQGEHGGQAPSLTAPEKP